MANLEGKVALVTGGSRGIGRAVAERLARDGAAVGINYRTDEMSARDVAQTIESAGSRATLLQGDVSEPDVAGRVVNQCLDVLGGIHIVINNAGIAIDQLTVRISDDDWGRSLSVNLSGAFYVTRAALRPLMRQRWGRIINMSSVVGLSGNAGQAAYAASKAGLLGLTKSVAREVAGRNVTVNAVAPGFIETDMTDRLSDEIRSGIIEQIPMKRMGSPEDVSGLVSYLASEEAGYITGQTVVIDGGMITA